jgi:uncharacterized oxidoreductase
LVILSDDQLQELGTQIFEAVDVPHDEAAWVTDCLVQSNLKGVDSHGVQQIPGYVRAIREGRLIPDAQLTLLQETEATALFDGGGGFGYTMARQAMEATIAKARRAGVAYTGVRNLHHIGRVGRWPELALEADMIGIASQPGGVYIAPYGGTERKLPISPIAVAIPTGRYPPIVIDMSLGPIAGGRAAILALRNQKVPPGWLIDDAGHPTDDPAGFHRGEGAQLPLGQTGLGYKGMALALIIDVFCGPLLGVFQGQASVFARRGVFFAAINVAAFTPIRDFKNGVDDVIDDIKSSRLAPHATEILVPGEPEWREQDRRKREGIFLDDAIYRRILDTAAQVGIDPASYAGIAGDGEVRHPSYTLRDPY